VLHLRRRAGGSLLANAKGRTTGITSPPYGFV
jgi:hypothetical protein